MHGLTGGDISHPRFVKWKKEASARIVGTAVKVSVAVYSVLSVRVEVGKFYVPFDTIVSRFFVKNALIHSSQRRNDKKHAVGP